MTVEDRKVRGSCLCERVAYEVAGGFEYALNCHCSQCRRVTGAAFKPLAGTKAEQLVITAGAGELLRYGNSEQGHDVHCRSCGSLLYSLVRELETGREALAASEAELRLVADSLPMLIGLIGTDYRYRFARLCDS